MGTADMFGTESTNKKFKNTVDMSADDEISFLLSIQFLHNLTNAIYDQSKTLYSAAKDVASGIKTPSQKEIEEFIKFYGELKNYITAYDQARESLIEQKEEIKQYKSEVYAKAHVLLEDIIEINDHIKSVINNSTEIIEIIS